MNFVGLQYRVEAIVRLTQKEVEELYNQAYEKGNGEFEHDLNDWENGFLAQMWRIAFGLISRDEGHEIHDYRLTAYEIKRLVEIIWLVPHPKWKPIQDAYDALAKQSKSLNNLKDGDRLL